MQQGSETVLPSKTSIDTTVVHFVRVCLVICCPVSSHPIPSHFLRVQAHPVPSRPVPFRSSSHHLPLSVVEVSSGAEPHRAAFPANGQVNRTVPQSQRQRRDALLVTTLRQNRDGQDYAMIGSHREGQVSQDGVGAIAGGSGATGGLEVTE